MRKTVVLSVRAGEEEAAGVRADAAEHGMTVSPYLLSLALGRRLPAVRRSTILADAEDVEALGIALAAMRRLPKQRRRPGAHRGDDRADMRR